METSHSIVFETAQHSYEGLQDSAELFDRRQIEREAWLLINNRSERPSAAVPKREYRDNARTALMEALTAAGHLSRVEISGSLDDINHQVLSRLLNGWDESLPWHEKQRRFAELCNELIIQKTHRLIVDGQAPEHTAVTELSDYPITLGDQDANSLGYRASNRKGMIRSTHLHCNDDGSFTRIIEQVSRANATPAASFRFYKAAGLNAVKAKPADLAVLEAPFVYSTAQYEGGVVDITRRLDAQAAAPVIYGDSIPAANRHAPYVALRQESQRRESEVEQFIGDLAALEQDLAGRAARAEIDRDTQLEIYNEQIMRVLNVICTNMPEYAHDTFGEKAAGYFEEAARFYAQGDSGMAQQLLERAETLKDDVTFCGQSISVKEAQEKGLTVSSFAELMEKSREKWQWKKGICVVKECPTRPAKTDVGPCSVCRKCQNIYDKGDNPKTVYRAVSFLDWLFGTKPDKNT